MPRSPPAGKLTGRPATEKTAPLFVSVLPEGPFQGILSPRLSNEPIGVGKLELGAARAKLRALETGHGVGRSGVERIFRGVRAGADAIGGTCRGRARRRARGCRARAPRRFPGLQLPHARPHHRASRPADAGASGQSAALAQGDRFHRQRSRAHGRVEIFPRRQADAAARNARRAASDLQRHDRRGVHAHPGSARAQLDPRARREPRQWQF